VNRVPLNGVDWGDLALTDAQRKALAGPPIASPWDQYERLFADWRGGNVFDYGYGPGGADDIRAVEKMLDEDGTARQVEQVLTLPLRGADWEVTGGTDRGRRLVQDQLPFATTEQLIAQCTSAVALWRAFFELRWQLDGSQVRLADYQLVPAASCEAAWTRNGRPDGFRQRVGTVGGAWNPANITAMSGKYPGYVVVPRLRAFVYTHGTHRRPLKGLSDLSVSRWAYDTRQKIMFLWCRFLENQALPNVLFYGDDETRARANATAFAGLKGAGTLGVKRPSDPAAKVFDVVESSGAGAAQFLEAIRWCEGQMIDSVLAGFTRLSSNAAAGAGSYALSADQSEFFLQSRQAVADEIAAQVTGQVYRLIVGLNGGAESDVPTLRIGPLSNRNTDRALGMLGTLVTATQVNAPDQFVEALILQTASYLGLDTEQMQEAIEAWARQKADQRERMAAQGMAVSADAGPNARAPGRVGQHLSNMVDAAHGIVQLAHVGVDPADLARLAR
jgi:hypothetical protein